MKSLTILLALAASNFSFAQVRTLSCDNKALVLEERCLSYRYVECYDIQRTLKISDKAIVSYLEQMGAMMSNSEGQFAVYGGIESLDAQGSKYQVKTSANESNVLLKLNKNESGLLLEAFNYEERPSAHGVRLIISERIADWKFQVCE